MLGGTYFMQHVLLKNCLLVDMEAGSTYKSDILIENDKIKEISKNLDFQSDNLKTVDVRENYVLPGFVDCHTHMGIIEESIGKLGLDNNETSEPITPQIRALDAVNPLDVAFLDAIKSGVTTIMCTPGSNNPIGGQNFVMKVHGSILDKMLVKNPLGLKVAFGEDPISTYGTSDKCPVTRMGVAALIRETFFRAQDYMYNKEQGKIKERDIKLEAVVPVLKGDIYLRAHAHRADDMVTAIRIAEEFNIKKLVIEHGTEAALIKDYLVEKNVPIALGPVLTPRIKVELRARDYSLAAKLVEAGIKVALITDHPYNSIDQLRPIAILTVSEGLAPIDALKCITINGAEILGCDNRLGKIKEGYDADLIIFNGRPLDMMSKVVATMINGEIVYVHDKYKDRIIIK
jgi:imidazolonepropionase-like amidohydrolase